MTKQSLLSCCLVLVLLLTACGANTKEGETNTETAPLPAGYALQGTVDLEGGGETYLYSTQFLNGKLYCGIYSYDEASGESAEAGAPAGGDISLGTGVSTERILTFSNEGEFLGEVNLALGNTRDSTRWCVDSEENIYIAAAENESFAASSGAMRLYKFDTEGNLLYRQEIPNLQGQSDHSLFIDDLAADAEGRVYVLFGEVVHLFSANGNYDRSVTITQDKPLYLIPDEMGNVYALCQAMDGGGVLDRIDPEKKTAETVYSDLPAVDKKIVWCAENALLCYTEAGLYLYDGERGEQKLLLPWPNLSLRSSDIRNFGVTAEGELKLLVNVAGANGKASQLRTFAPMTEEEAMARGGSAQSAEEKPLLSGASITSPGASADDEREVITLVGIFFDFELEDAIWDFNQSNEKYRIEVIDILPLGMESEAEWEDKESRLEMELALGTQDYDLISLTNLNVHALAEAGALEDLYPYLDACESLSREDFFQGVLNACVVDGKLMTVPKCCDVEAIIGKKADFGDRTGWTLREFLDYGLAHPDTRMFELYDELSLCYIMLRYGTDGFVSVEDGSVVFDAELCRDFLQIVERHMDASDLNEEESTATRIRRGDVLLDYGILTTGRSIVGCRIEFGEPVTFLGFPDPEGETSYFYYTSGSCAINSGSDKKEGAWEFLEFYLNNEVHYNFNIPTLKAKFEELQAQVLSDQWLKDEEGNLVPDENGELQLAKPEVTYQVITGGSWNWTVESVYPNEPATEEDVETLRNMLEAGGVAFFTLDDDVFNIIVEEADAYFTGQRPLDVVVDQIGNRLTLYLQEQQ